MRARTRRLAALSTLAALVSVSVVALGPGQLAGANTHDDKRKVDAKIHAAKDDLDDITKSLRVAYARLQATRKQAAAAQTALATAQAQLAAATARDDAIAADLTAAEDAQDEARAELAATKAQAVRTTNILGGLAREVYQGSSLTTLSVAMSARTPDDLATGLALADTAARMQQQALQQLGVQRAQDAAVNAKLTAAEAEVADLKAQSAAAVASDTALEQSAAAAKAKVDAIATRQSADVTSVRHARRTEHTKLAALNHQSRLLAKKLRALARRHHGGIYRSANGFLSYPARGPLTSPFGMRFHPILHYWRLHAGQDWGIACGTPVRAAAGGRIVSSGWAGGYGYQVVIDHGRVNHVDLATSYNHLSRIVRHSGKVKRGQLIAYSGTTGLSTGCHLHFETRENGVPVDPRKWL